MNRSNAVMRSLSIRLFIAVLLVMLGLPAASPVAAQEAASFGDPAAMALNPLDLRSAGMTGFGIDRGQFLTANDAAQVASGQFGIDAAIIAAALENSNYVNGYSLALAAPTEFGNPDAGQSAFVASTIYRFENEAGATTAFAAIAAEGAIPNASLLVTPEAAGSDVWIGAAQISNGTQSEPQSGLIAIERTGNWIGLVSLTPGTVQTDVQPLLDRLIEKVDILTSGPGPDAGLRTLQFSGEEVTTQTGIYFISYGAPMRLTTQSDAAFAQVGQSYPNAVDGYQQIQVIEAANGAKYAVQIVTLRFADAAGASNWLAAVVQQAGEAGVDAEAPVLGDASVTRSYTNAANQAVRQVTMQSGDSISVVEIIGLDPVDPAALVDVASMQADCLASGCEPAAVPASLLGSATLTPGTPEPADVATGEAVAATPETDVVATEETGVSTPVSVAASSPVADATAVTGMQVVSEEIYGIQVSYDSAQWEVANQVSDGARSEFEFSNGVATVGLVADAAYSGNPQACFDAATAQLEQDGATNLTAGQNSQGEPIFSATDQTVQGVFTYTNAAGEGSAAFIYCTKLTEGGATLLAVATTPAEQFNDQQAAIAQLIQGVRVVSQ